MVVLHALSAVLRYPCDRGALTAKVLLAPFKEPSLQRWTSLQRIDYL